MSPDQDFQPHSADQQAKYEAEAVNRWGDTVKQTARLWNTYTEEQRAAIMAEGSATYTALVAAMPTGPDSPEVQALLARWHQHLRYFYEPSIETLAGLGQMYHDDPDFNATFAALHPDLPAFLQQAIAKYVDTLETRWLEQELGLLKE
ncbi:MAG: TipAS antibiotic-recognition domain-containing protein [Anaerolineales bacterium]|nr:TipAS antibiotic-recognition domain-containing protein [Anaerolineales bacterium]